VYECKINFKEREGEGEGEGERGGFIYSDILTMDIKAQVAMS